MELVSVLGRVNCDSGGGHLALEALTDRTDFPALSCLHICCTSF